MRDPTQPDPQSIPSLFQRDASRGSVDATSVHGSAELLRSSSGWRRFGGLAITVLVTLTTMVLNQIGYTLALWALRTSVWTLPGLCLFLLLQVGLMMFLWERVASVARGLLWGVALSIALQLLLMALLILNIR